MAELRENVIEWLNGQDTIAVTLSQGRYISKVKKLAKRHPDQVKILAENEDGSIFAHLPIRALKLNLSAKRELSEEERRKIGARLHSGKNQFDVDDEDVDDEGEEDDWSDWDGE